MTTKKQESKEQIEGEGRGPGVAENGVDSLTVVNPTSTARATQSQEQGHGAETPTSWMDTSSRAVAGATAGSSHYEQQTEGQGQGAETPTTYEKDTSSRAVAVAPAGSTSSTPSMTSDAVASAPAFGEDNSMSPTFSNSSTTSDAVISAPSRREPSSNSTVNNTMSTPSTGSQPARAGANSPTYPPITSADAVALARFAGRAAKAMEAMGFSQAAAFLAVLTDPGAEHRVLSERFGINPKSFTRATASAQEHGFLVGRAGAWVPVLPQLDGGDGPAPIGPQDVRRNLADRLAVAEAGLLRFGGVKYGSSLERDVALVLTGARAKFEVQQPYTSFVTTGRAWTADFVVTVGGVKVVVEATGRADAAATVEEKVKVLDGAKVPYVVVRGHGDLDGLVQKVVDRAKAAAAAQRAEPEHAAVPEAQRPRVTAGGVYVDPRAVRDRNKPVEPYVPVVRPEPLPALPVPPAVPGLELADHELRRLEELQEEADDRYLQERLSAARAQARADLAQIRESETPEQKKERAAGLLRADHERWRAEHGAAAVAERRHRGEQRDRAEAEAVYQPDGEDEVELTGEECAEQDELPDDTEAGRGE